MIFALLIYVLQSPLKKIQVSDFDGQYSIDIDPVYSRVPLPDGPHVVEPLILKLKTSRIEMVISFFPVFRRSRCG